VLDSGFESFVGSGTLPMRHGLTTGEAALFLNQKHHADLEVVKMEGWDPKKYWHELGRDWILTSPMLPQTDSLYVYPGTVLIEGTNLSEGRGTTLPFQFIGAPYIKEPTAFIAKIKEHSDGAPGLKFRPASFIPTWNKWQGKGCEGIHLVIENFAKIRSYALTLAIIRSCIELYDKEFEFEKPGYEYDYENLPINLLIGSKVADKMLLAANFSNSDHFWHDGIEDFIEKVKPMLLYPRLQTQL